MNTYPNLLIRIEAHTDSRGSDDYNVKLGQRRARSAKKYLVEKGISQDRISTEDLVNQTPLMIVPMKLNSKNNVMKMPSNSTEGWMWFL